MTPTPVTSFGGMVDGMSGAFAADPVVLLVVLAAVILAVGLRIVGMVKEAY